ncbi:multiple C2 domain and transmembrane region protein 14 [Rutidosis leptorrhynchoides]|uniref:multiple C2 domain and transmembrane region protein 14 n=1 Tax=Rutidosis leptorrhynchoides TaxID=125765 RepID=UPI003A99BB96
MANRKLIVEVCNAKNLMPKDGQGTASAYVIVDFDGQRRRTKTISRDLNPQWDEKVEFLVHDVASMNTEILELNVYNDNKKTGKRSTFLGKVKITGSTFPVSGSEALVYYPLEKRSVFSQIKGEIGIKICYVDEEPPAAEPAGEQKPEVVETPPPPATDEKPPEEEKKAEEKPKEDGEKKEEKPPEEQKKEDAPPPAVAVVPPQPPPPPENTAMIQSPKPKQAEEKLQLIRKPSNFDRDDARVSLSNHHRRSNAYDLVDRMPFLYVKVVKAKRSEKDSDDSTLYYAKLEIGTHSISTKALGTSKDWDQVFAFDKEGLNSTSLEVSVFDRKKKVVEEGKEEVLESCLGTVSFDLPEVPKRVPPDSPLAPQWYTLEGSATDVMLAVWLGTQADEAFQEAWQSDSGGLIPETRAKVYLSPKLWYLRLTVIQTQDLQLGSGGPEPRVKNPELFVKGQLGPQLFKTNRTTVGLSSTSSNPTWNEDLVFVAAEPFEPFLVITVEDASNGQTVGHAKVHVGSIDKRTDDRSVVGSRWFNLVGDESHPYAGRIHVGVCLEGGYHVLDEAAHVTSDVRPTAKQLSKPPIGLLEVGIRGASNLLPVKTMDGTRGTTDSYVVAKYGPKWVRTRTILDRFNPRWNEQYTWEVYDPCTVLTIGVFDNGRYKIGEGDQTPSKDVRLGKLRVRLSTLDTNRVYTGSYSLIVLLPNGAKKMGEIEIAVRFSCSSWISLLQAYSTPMLPRMHYVRPMGPMQQDMLRHNAMKIVTARLARSEPALGQEVVQFMLDSDTHIWSMRRSKSNWFRIVNGLSKAATLARWLDSICTWVHPPTTVLVHVLLLAIVICPHLILPTVCLYAFLIVALRYRYRIQVPVTMDPRLSQVDSVGPDELDEEFDGFPSSKTPDQIRIRYDRLRALAGRAQTLIGDVAAQGERLEALCNWRDPRATGIFVVVCLLASLVFYVVPFKVFLLGWGFFYMRHPRFRGDMPSLPVNFFRRLPPLSDQIL